MFKSGKTTVLLLVLIVILSLFATGITYYYLTNEKTKRIAFEKQLQEIQLIKKDLENQLSVSKEKINNLDDQLSESKVKIEGLTTQLDMEKIAREQIMLERDNLVTELNNKVASLQELTEKLSKTEEQIQTLQKQLAQPLPEKGPDEKIKETGKTEEVELEKIVVAAGKLPEGEILTINKEHNFVVINLGQKDGIKSGQTLSVYHGKKIIGSIQIVEVQDELSVANLLLDTNINSILEGDRVVAK